MKKGKTLTTILEQIGLSEQEQTLYLALLHMGSGTLADIVRETKTHRPTMQKWIPLLLEKDLISAVTKGKRTVYYPASPTQLQTLVQETERALSAFLPNLQDIYDTTHEKPTIRYFEGKNITTLIYTDVLDTCQKGDIIYRHEAPVNYKTFTEWLPPEYFERMRERKEVQQFVIVNEKTAKGKKHLDEDIERVVPTDIHLFNTNVTQLIYKHKIAFIDFESSTAWIIENTRFAEFQRALFIALFQTLENI